MKMKTNTPRIGIAGAYLIFVILVGYLVGPPDYVFNDNFESAFESRPYVESILAKGDASLKDLIPKEMTVFCTTQATVELGGEIHLLRNLGLSEMRNFRQVVVKTAWILGGAVFSLLLSSAIPPKDGEENG